MGQETVRPGSGSSWETDSEEMFRVWHGRLGRTGDMNRGGNCGV